MISIGRCICLKQSNRCLNNPVFIYLEYEQLVFAPRSRIIFKCSGGSESGAGTGAGEEEDEGSGGSHQDGDMMRHLQMKCHSAIMHQF